MRMAKKRETWDSRLIFVMAAVGSAVGLGNVWRFPYTCYKYGGGAFLIPFFVALFTAGIPLMILEFGLGHKMRASAPMAFKKIKEKYEWVGWFAVLVGLFVMTYYGVVMSWCFRYLAYAFNLAWGRNTESFFYKHVLELSSGIGHLNGVMWWTLLGLFLCWLMVFFSIVKGVKSVGKVVMWTVPLPVLILVAFVLRGITLPGAMEGLSFYLTPDFKALLNWNVWIEAYAQVFFSLSIGFGVMIAYGSFLPRDSDVTNNAFITSLADAGICFMAGFAVFATLGYLAHVTGQPVKDVVASGPGLTFVTYPLIINKLHFIPQVFGVMFFMLLLSLGIDSAFSLVEAGVAGAIDKWKFPRVAVNAVISFLAFLVGVLYTTRAGLYWLDIIDNYLTNYGLAIVGIIECIVVGYVLGARKIREHVNKTSEIKLGVWWDICIKVITPVMLFWMIIMKLFNMSGIWSLITGTGKGPIKNLIFNPPYENYPTWAQIAGGWGLLAALLIIGIILALIKDREEQNA